MGVRTNGLGPSTQHPGSGTQHAAKRKGRVKDMSAATAAAVEDVAASRQGWRAALGIIVNPGGVIKSQMASVPWPFAFAISGSAFTLFFLQTGLDLARQGSGDPTRVVLLAVAGALYGTAGIALLAVLAWAVTRPFRTPNSLGWALRAFGLAYSATLIYAAFGVVANVALGWNTAVAFGVTGVLWALAPMNAVLQEMARGKLAVGLLLTTLCGALLLCGWAWLGNL